MLASSAPDETFVNAPEIVDICWMSDDPMFNRAPKDLYYEMMKGEGLSDSYGKKDSHSVILQVSSM